MKTVDCLTITLVDGESVEVVVDDLVYPDRTCGQYDQGALVWNEVTDREWFLSITGDLWDVGTDYDVVGTCAVIAAQYKAQCEDEDRLESEREQASSRFCECGAVLEECCDPPSCCLCANTEYAL